MDWSARVEEWKKHPVTEMFITEIEEDIEYLMASLLSTDPVIMPMPDGSNATRASTSEDYMQIRGMIKALKGVLDMGVTDPIRDPNFKGDK